MGDPNKTVENQESQLGTASSNAGSQYLDLSLPGFQTAESYYRKLASGDPGTVTAALEPQTSQIEQQYAGAVQSAKHELARGGAEGDVTGALANQRAGQIAGLRAKAVESAYPALAQIGAATGNLSVDTIYNAMNAFQTVGKLRGDAKASTMGLIGGLGQDAATLGGAAITAGAFGL